MLFLFLPSLSSMYVHALIQNCSQQAVKGVTISILLWDTNRWDTFSPSGKGSSVHRSSQWLSPTAVESGCNKTPSTVKVMLLIVLRNSYWNHTAPDLLLSVHLGKPCSASCHSTLFFPDFPRIIFFFFLNSMAKYPTDLSWVITPICSHAFMAASQYLATSGEEAGSKEERNTYKLRAWKLAKFFSRASMLEWQQLINFALQFVSGFDISAIIGINTLCWWKWVSKQQRCTQLH